MRKTLVGEIYDQQVEEEFDSESELENDDNDGSDLYNEISDAGFES